ncbi:MAG: alkyl sulfatase dimerization domain-containing protein [Pirellulaceae bacterium]
MTGRSKGTNKGLTPDELVEHVQLPEDFASKDYLQPFYGHPEGECTVFSEYLGWFDGNPSNLFRLSPKAEAERVAKLAGVSRQTIGIRPRSCWPQTTITGRAACRSPACNRRGRQ